MWRNTSIGVLRCITVQDHIFNCKLLYSPVLKHVWMEDPQFVAWYSFLINPIATNDLFHIDFSISLGQDTPTWISQSCSKGGTGSFIQPSSTVPLNMHKISWHLPVPYSLPQFQTCNIIMDIIGFIKRGPLAHHFQSIEKCPDRLPAPLHSNLGILILIGCHHGYERMPCLNSWRHTFALQILRDSLRFTTSGSFLHAPVAPPPCSPDHCLPN